MKEGREPHQIARQKQRESASRHHKRRAHFCGRATTAWQSSDARLDEQCHKSSVVYTQVTRYTRMASENDAGGRGGKAISRAQRSSATALRRARCGTSLCIPAGTHVGITNSSKEGARTRHRHRGGHRSRTCVIGCSAGPSSQQKWLGTLVAGTP